MTGLLRKVVDLWRSSRASKINRRGGADHDPTNDAPTGATGVPRQQVRPKPATTKPATTVPATTVPAATVAVTAAGRRLAKGGRTLVYAPQLDGRADPGEIVWTWVEYEDEPGRGKDRPVLVIGRAGAVLLGLMLSSRTIRDGQRHWFALGPGDWDRDKRPSWVRLDRVLELREDGIRREGAVLDRARFERIAAALREGYGWR